MKLRVNGFFELPDGENLPMALFRLSVRLRQMADGRTDADDWIGVLEIVGDDDDGKGGGT
jgi:hypothetical protein